MTLALGVHLHHRDDLGMGIQPFWLFQHTYAASTVLKSGTDQHQFIDGSSVPPTLSDAAYLTAPNGVSLPEIMANGADRAWAPEGGPGQPPPPYQGTDAVFWDLMDR